VFKYLIAQKQNTADAWHLKKGNAGNTRQTIHHKWNVLCNNTFGTVLYSNALGHASLFTAFDSVESLL